MADTRSTTAQSSTPAKKSTAKKSTAKKVTAKKAATKKSTTKKSTAKKSTAKKTTAKKTTAKRAPAKRTVTRSVERTGPSASSSSLVARAAAATQKPVEAGKALAGRAGERVADVGRAVAAPSSRIFARAPVRARELAADPEALRGLADRAADKALHSASGRNGPLGEVADEFRTLGRMVAAYARGDYRDIPLDSLIMVVAGLVYVVSPIDLIPEFVPVAGYVDDAVAVGFVIRQVHHELTAFRTWEDQRSSTT